MIPFGTGLEQLRWVVTHLAATGPALWGLVAIGVTTPWWDAPARRAAPFVGLFTLCSLLAVATGWRFTEHYFVLALPAAALLAGGAASAIGRWADRHTPGWAAIVRVAVPATAVLVSLARERVYLFVLPPTAVARATYGLNPFPEAVDIARRLRDRTRPDERIAVIGSEPQVYFYAGRRAATSYIYMYPLMEPHPFARRMQDEMIAQLERERPRFLVLVNVDSSWTRQPDSPLAIMEWATRATAADYHLVGLTEILPDGTTAHHWDAEAPTAPIRSRTYVLTFERNA
jgi:hypothetical protein